MHLESYNTKICLTDQSLCEYDSCGYNHSSLMNKDSVKTTVG